MHISWLGKTAFRIQAKTNEGDINILIDPYRMKVGSCPRNLSADIVLLTRGEEDLITLSGKPFVLSSAGECDVKGVLITSVQGHEAGETMLRVDAEDMSLGHLGLCKKQLNEEQKEALSSVDILCVPVGGLDCFDEEEAIKAINDIEPSVVIPMAMKSDNDPNAQGVERFLKEMGMSQAAKPEKKIIIKKKDLPIDETQIMVIAKE